MACPHLSLRRRMLATGVAMTVSAGCALKAPPDAVAIRVEALPFVHSPVQWPAAVATDPVVDGWLATFRDEELMEAVAEAIAHNADLRVGATRVEQARLHAKLAGARLWPSV